MLVLPKNCYNNVIVRNPHEFKYVNDEREIDQNEKPLNMSDFIFLVK